MLWTDPETIIAILAALGLGGGGYALKKYNKLPFGNNSNGNGAKAIDDHVKSSHVPIDAKLARHDTDFINLGKVQVKQNLLIQANTARMAEDRKYHDKRFDEGRDQFKQIVDSIGDLKVDVGILLSRPKNQRFSDQ